MLKLQLCYSTVAAEVVLIRNCHRRHSKGGEVPVSDMSTDLKSEATTPEPNETNLHTGAADIENSGDTPENSEEAQSTQQLQEFWEKISGVLGNLPDYVAEFFKTYQRPLITVVLIIAAFIAVRLLLAVLEAVNELPLLSPLFELIGLGYSGWFIYRYLLREANRQELMENLTSLRDQVLGKHP